jgi:(S)-2-hydroxy-acid oxidase
MSGRRCMDSFRKIPYEKEYKDVCKIHVQTMQHLEWVYPRLVVNMPPPHPGLRKKCRSEIGKPHPSISSSQCIRKICTHNRGKAKRSLNPIVIHICSISSRSFRCAKFTCDTTHNTQLCRTTANMANSTAHDLNCLTIEELEKLAAERMDKQTRDYYNEGADAGSTLAENMSAYQKYRIRPRVLRDVSAIDTSVSLFGHKNSIPLGVAPTAMQGLAHPDGELATARACKNSSVVMGLSSFSTTSLEDVKGALGAEHPGVLQLYLFEDREESQRLIQRAKKAGYKAVFLTVDTPMLGRRNLEIRNQFTLPKHLKVANFSHDNDAEKEKEEIKDRDTQAHNSSESESKRIPPKGPITFHTHAPNPTLNWERDITWLKEQCHPAMQVWVKGIATAEDALLACHHGVDGIVVSNHGGRQLNGALATIDALPEVAEAVRSQSKKIPVHVDGGIRHGTDIFKALALGADFVWIGRPVLWGLAYKGQEGVELCLKLLADEVRLCMGLAGVTRVGDIGKEYLVKMDRSGFVSRL